MKKKFLFSVLFTVLSMSFVAAQEINGHWSGRLMDQYDINYDFKADGNVLTGKDTHPDGSVSDISNGKIDADSLSFDVPIQGQTTHITGKLVNSVLTLKFAVQGYDVSVDMKKTTAK
ncbi:MAG: hypothetical protein ACRDE8_07480 [Ginsengibacter sp.]